MKPKTIGTLKKLLFTWLILTGVSIALFEHSETLKAQSIGVAGSIQYGPTLPAVCNPRNGRVFITQTTPPVFYVCTALNTWSAVSTNAGAGVAGEVSFFNTASTITGDATMTFAPLTKTFAVSTQTVASEVDFAPVLFASLGTPLNGAFKYCSNCQVIAVCNSGGTGAFAKRIAGVWVCN